MRNLDDLLQQICVEEPGMWENELTPLLGGWWGVSTPHSGIVAYFFYERDAFRFRLDLINQLLNPTHEDHKKDGLS